MKLLALLFLLLPRIVFATCDITVFPDDNKQLASIFKAAGEGARICLSEGVYTVNQTIRMKNYQRLSGQGNVVIDADLSSDQNIIRMASGVRIDHISFDSSTSLPKTAIFGREAHDAVIWSVTITDTTRSGIAFINSDRVRLLGVHFNKTGLAGDHKPNPSLWFRNSNNILIWYGTNRGRGSEGTIGSGTHPGAAAGDGSIACHDSKGFVVVGLRSFDIGTGTYYLVNCDNATLSGVKNFRDGGWSIDVPWCTDNLLVENSYITRSARAGAHIGNTVTGTVFTDNVFYRNNREGKSGCSGISAHDPSSVTHLRNTVVPEGELICQGDGGHPNKICE